MLAVGPLGNRIGTVVAMLPYGSGAVTFVGMPLLEPVDGDADPRRDAVLAHLLMEVASEAVWRRASEGTPEPTLTQPVAAFEPAEEQAIEHAFGAIRRVVALADRYSAVHGGSTPLPEDTGRAIDELNRGLHDLARNNLGKGRQHLLRAFESAWDDETAAFLALEEEVLAGVRRLREAGDDAALLAAHGAIDLWESGVVEWFTGRRDTAFAWLGRAELLLAEAEVAR
jgi:hypothetical protein